MKGGTEMTILVTGGAGFIGSNFVFYMMKKYPDYRIVCLDSLTYAGNINTLKPIMDSPRFRFVKADITDTAAPCRPLHNFAGVIYIYKHNRHSGAGRCMY